MILFFSDLPWLVSADRSRPSQALFFIVWSRLRSLSQYNEASLLPFIVFYVPSQCLYYVRCDVYSVLDFFLMLCPRNQSGVEYWKWVPKFVTYRSQLIANIQKVVSVFFNVACVSPRRTNLRTLISRCLRNVRLHGPTGNPNSHRCVNLRLQRLKNLPTLTKPTANSANWRFALWPSELLCCLRQLL
jgi:hypothetical protein